MFRQRLFRRDGDGGGFSPTQSQMVLEEKPHLLAAASDSRQLFDSPAGFGDRVRRAPTKFFRQRLSIACQGARRNVPLELPDFFQAALPEQVENALDSASRDPCQHSYSLMGFTMHLQRKNLHPPLHVWIGMPVSFVLDGLPLLFREFESSHLFPPDRARPIVPMNVQHRFLRVASFEIIFSHRIQGKPKLNVSFVHGYGIQGFWISRDYEGQFKGSKHIGRIHKMHGWIK